MVEVAHKPGVGFQPFAQEQNAPTDLGFFDALAPAFRLENDVYALAEFAARPDFNVDESFDIREAIRGSDYRLDYFGELARARSQEEFDFITGRIEQETKDKEILASAGVGGFMAGMLAGTVSPTMAIPLVGPARGIKGAGQAFALAFGAASAQEAALFLNQETRTGQDVAIGIAAGTVLGGLLGSGSIYLRGKARQRVEADMAQGRGDEAISYAAPPSTLKATEEPTIVASRDFSAELPVYSRSAHIDGDDVIVFNDKGVPVPVQVTRTAEGELVVVDAKNVTTPLGAKYSDINPRAENYILQSTDKAKVADLTPEELITRVKGLEQELAQIPSTRETPEVLAKKQDYVAMLAESQRRVKDPTAGRTVSEIEDELSLDDEVVVSTPEAEVATTRAELEEFARKADGLPDNVKPTYGDLTVSNAAGKVDSVGAAVNPATARRRATLKKADKVTGAIIRQMAKLNPVTRQIEQPHSTLASYWAARFSDAGLVFEGNSAGLSQAAEGTMQSRAAAHIGTLGNFVQEFDEAYGRYIVGADAATSNEQVLAKIRSGIGALPEGKMNWEEFGEVAYGLANTGKKAEDPAVEAAVSAMHKMFKYYRDAADEALEFRKELDPDARPMFDPNGNLGPDVVNYVHHIFNTVKIGEDPAAFRADVAANTIRNSNKSFQRSVTTFKKNYAQRKERLDAMQLSEEEAIAEISQLDLEIATVNDIPEMRTHNKIMTEYEELEENLQSRIAEGKSVDFTPIEGDADVLQAAKKSLRDELSELRRELKDLKTDRKDYLDGIKKETQEGIDQVSALTRRKNLVEEVSGADEDTVRKAIRDLDRFEDDFLERWRGRGAVDIDVEEGTADFSIHADEMSEILFGKLMGLGENGSMMDILQGDRGPQLARTLNMPFDMKKKWLHQDPEFVMRRYARQMSADVELYRATGSVNGQQMFKEVAEEFNNLRRNLDSAKFVSKQNGVWKPAPAGTKGAKELTPKLRSKLHKQLLNAQRSSESDLKVLVERLRHQRGMPDNAHGLAYRAGRTAADINVVRLMGTVVPSSLADVGRSVMKRGLLTTFRDGYLPFFTDLTKVKMTREQARNLGIAWDPILHNRAQAVFDMFEDNGLRQSALEKATGFLANKTGAVALFDRWTAEMKMIAAQIGMSEMSRSLRLVVEGGGSAKELKNAVEFLTNHGIEESMAKKIWAQFKRPGGSTEFDGGVLLPNMESWTDFRTMSAFRQAMVKFADDTIVTPGLDRPSWMDANVGARLVAQFRSFTFTANNRILMAGLQQRDMALVNGVSVSLAMGALSYYTWAVATGGDAYDEMMKMDFDKWADEAIARSGLMGVFTEGQRIAEQVPFLSEYATFSGTPVTNRRPSSIISSVAGPSYDLAERMTNVALGINEPTQATVHQLRTLMPYQNVFYFRQVLDGVEEGAINQFNIPERRDRR